MRHRIADNTPAYVGEAITSAQFNGPKWRPRVGFSSCSWSR
jgi:hypothetical protein